MVTEGVKDLEGRESREEKVARREEQSKNSNFWWSGDREGQEGMCRCIPKVEPFGDPEWAPYHADKGMEGTAQRPRLPGNRPSQSESSQ